MSVTKVRDLMSAEVERLKIGESLDLARGIMKHRRIRHLPVVDAENRLVGMVSHRDVLNAWIGHTDPTREDPRAVAREVPVEMLMTKDLTAVRPDTLAADAAALLERHRFGCLPVVDEGQHVIGIITEADFVRFARKYFENEVNRGS